MHAPETKDLFLRSLQSFTLISGYKQISCLAFIRFYYSYCWCTKYYFPDVAGEICERPQRRQWQQAPFQISSRKSRQNFTDGRALKEIISSCHFLDFSFMLILFLFPKVIGFQPKKQILLYNNFDFFLLAMNREERLPKVAMIEKKRSFYRVVLQNILIQNLYHGVTTLCATAIQTTFTIA